MTLMLGLQIPFFDRLCGSFLDLFSFQVIIYLIICDSQGYFIRNPRLVTFQIGSWYFFDQMFRCSQLSEQLFPLPLIQSKQWIDVCSPVTMLRVKTRHSLCCMVRT